MKFELLYLIPILFIWVACASPEPDSETGEDAEIPEAVESDESEKYPHHNARNALDYLGAYEGVVPCDDCEGILMRINLFEGDEYRLRRTFLGLSDEVSEDKGSFSWDEKGSTITFENVDPPNQFFVAENRLILLDEDGERYTGEDEELYYLPKRR